jgi:hypothetical protein
MSIVTIEEQRLEQVGPHLHAAMCGDRGSQGFSRRTLGNCQYRPENLARSSPGTEHFGRGLQLSQSAIHGVLQQAFVAAVVVLYSKNFFSAAIRALISS